jgi:phosphopentomutase
MKKMIPSSRLQQNKDKLYQGIQQSPQEQSEWRNPASNHWEFYGDVTRHDNKNVQEALKKFQEDRIKNMRKHKNKSWRNWQISRYLQLSQTEPREH